MFAIVLEADQLWRKKFQRKLLNWVQLRSSEIWHKNLIFHVQPSISVASVFSKEEIWLPRQLRFENLSHISTISSRLLTRNAKCSALLWWWKMSFAFNRNQEKPMPTRISCFVSDSKYVVHYVLLEHWRTITADIYD